MKRLRELWWVFLLYGLFLTGYQGWNYATAPAASKGADQIIVVPPGSSFSATARLLEDKGVIRSRYGFFLLAWLKGATQRIQAGEYRLSPMQPPTQILSDLVAGKSLQYVVTIPEGYNIFQIADEIDRAHLVAKDDFLAAAHDPALLKELNIPGDSAEGFLFPDTYFLKKGASAEDTVRTFVHRFWSVWTRDGFDKRTAELGLDPHKVVTLASIVEEEAMAPRERPIIAGVFWNRLQKNMPLQADPTVYYGLLAESEVKKKRLRWKDLKTRTAYNTYVIKGLPKGPISNPGQKSLQAVLYPAKTDYLYFVSKNNGTHCFSSTLKEHNRAVDQYQRGHAPAQKTEQKPTAPVPVAPETSSNATSAS